jgi:hypothetical protein
LDYCLEKETLTLDLPMVQAASNRHRGSMRTTGEGSWIAHCARWFGFGYQVQRLCFIFKTLLPAVAVALGLHAVIPSFQDLWVLVPKGTEEGAVLRAVKGRRGGHAEVISFALVSACIFSYAFFCLVVGSTYCSCFFVSFLFSAIM